MWQLFSVEETSDPGFPLAYVDVIVDAFEYITVASAEHLFF